eukprot:CAMPEP_0181315904 /NCGR_PEP_ID=MMETSP1101-20121128/15617_1 /TAXON_ID=46948 /ORGANISM="Rhodomonas abbreviata, Strain Caron Lab Isolate" /LENGTH=489 /DNA_ID=CAMNT_0023423129 /DNA_START=83 /DNA_END=1548 /DNA_ORIENTATION=-
MPATDDMYGLIGCLELEDQPVKHIPVPLVGISVKAEVHGFIAEVEVKQSYRNTEEQPIEVVYHFPLDTASAVCAFEAEYEDGTVVVGTVKEKVQAQKEYSTAIKEGKQAQLLQAKRSDIFTLHVGSIPPSSHVTIKFTYITTLKAEGDSSRFLLPTHVAPRYSPSNFVSDLPSVEAPTTILHGLNVEINFHGSRTQSVSTPTHPADINVEKMEGVTRASMRNIALDRDLIVLCQQAEAHEPRACVEVREDGSVAGLVTLFPQIEFRDIAREFVFIIDRSGSMSYPNHRSQIKQAGEALLFFLRSLPSSAAFNIIGFGSDFKPLFKESRPYNDDSLEEASEYAKTLAADMGGTEILKPLSFALKAAPHREGCERQVFILTDGQVANNTQVFDLVRSHCHRGNAAQNGENTAQTGSNTRVFCLGLGRNVSHSLVEGVAKAGKGTAVFAPSESVSELRDKVLSQLKQALQPSLNDVSVRWNFPPPPENPAPP